MKIVIIVLGIFAVALLAMAAIGSCLPRDHVATRMAVFHRPIRELYATIRDFSHQAEWRSGLKAVEILPDLNGKSSFREVSKHGAVRYVVLDDKPDERLVIEIADPSLPYGGMWTFELRAASEGGTLRITERGFVKNVIFRLLSRTIFSPTSTMETYLRDLGTKFGETAEPQP